MYITKMKKSVAGCLLIITNLLLLAVSVLGAEQEFKTLKLVGTYQSEAEIQATYPDVFPKTNTIQVNRNEIQFVDADTGNVLKRIQTQQFSMEFKKPLTEAELQQASEPIIGEMVDRHLSDDKTFLVVSEGTIQRQGVDDFVEGTFHVTKNTLYNANGDVMTELPLEARMIVVSPHTRDFVAYNWAEFGGPPSIYFYSSDGTLLQRQEIFERARVRFSQNGKFITMVGDTREFAIFTNTGKLIYQGDSKEFIPDIRLLRRVCVSENVEQMLLATDLMIYLFTIQGKLLWKSPTPGIDLLDCHFFSPQQKIALKMMTGRSGNDRYKVQIHSLATGEEFEEISRVTDITSTNDRLIITKGGQYYEYLVR